MTNLFESGGITRQFVRTLLLTVVIALFRVGFCPGTHWNSSV